MTTEKKMRYFFGTNSAEGFFAFREEYLPPAERRRVCILKGGPGTGKSGLMKKVAALGEAAGFVCEYYHCASDPDSLDGIVFPERGTAVVDGTSPHVIEAGCAGAVEDYISFSPYWDSDGIAAHREDIERETGVMRQEFTAAYRYLNAAAELWANVLDTSLTAVTRERLNRRGRALARRYIPTEKVPGGSVVRRFLGGITPAGRIFFGDTVSALCDRVVVLEDRLGLAPFVLAPVLNAAKAAGLHVIAAYCPLNPKKLEHILLPELRVGFVTDTPDHPFRGTGVRGVRTDHIPDRELLDPVLPRLREDERRAEQLMNSACAALARAKARHDRLEACYVPHMNFAGVDRLAETVADKVLG